MPIFVFRLTQLLRSRLVGWRLPLAIAVFVFATSWLAMWLVEPSTGITDPSTYWWYFMVTAATVGYGDVFPQTLGGRLVGVYVIVGGIATLTVLFTQLGAYLQTARGRRMRGVAPLDLDGHIVILGYTPGRTERIVGELAVEGRGQIALGAWDDVPQHPMPEQPEVAFVRGDLTSVDVMTRACVARARTVVVDGRDDNETLAIAVAVDHANPDGHLVAALRDLGRRQHLQYVNPHVQCVQWHMPYLITEEALDPGISAVYADLMSSGGNANTYSMRLPEQAAAGTFGDWQVHLGRTFGATVLAMRGEEGVVVSPAWDTPVTGGALLYYVAGTRIDPAALSRGSGPSGAPGSAAASSGR